MDNLYVLYSNEMATPGKIKEVDEGLFYHVQEIGEENSEGMRYAHYYEKVLDDYDFVEYHYVTTKNA